MKAALCALFFVVGCSHVPKPKYEIVNIEGGVGKYVHLICPNGWNGNATWNTFPGLTEDEQIEQYLKDAKKTGVCLRSGTSYPDVDMFQIIHSV